MAKNIQVNKLNQNLKKFHHSWKAAASECKIKFINRKRKIEKAFLINEKEEKKTKKRI